MEDPKAITLKWPNSVKDVPTHYANALWVTHAGPEFFLVFGEFSPPVGEEEPPDVIEIQPLIKIAITPEVMMSMAEAIQGNVEKYKERVQQQAEVDNASTE